MDFFPVASIVLLTTHQCNLKCSYCFCHSHNYIEKHGGMMSFSIAKRVIDGFFAVPTCKTNQRIFFSFFGGEPLLNFEMIEETVEYLEKWFPNRASFFLTTNGLLLTSKIAEFLVRHRIVTLVSIDGPKELHDQHRVYEDGTGSFDGAMQGLLNLQKAGAPAGALRATFTAANPKLLERTVYLHQLLDEGLTVNVAIEPEVPYRGDPNDLKSEYDSVVDFLFDRLQQNKKAHFFNIMTYLERFNKMLYLSECGAGRGIITIAPDGKIYACHRAGESAIGDIENGIDENKRLAWKITSVTSNPTCLDCEVFGICGGPCRYQSLERFHSLAQPDEQDCKFRKIWIESAMKLMRRMANARIQRESRETEGLCSYSPQEYVNRSI